MAKTRKAFVTGFPINHSRSPLIHGFWLKTYGLSGSYEAIEIDRQAFQPFILTLDEKGFVGGNITIPYKEDVLSLCTRRDTDADAIGSVNTVWFENDQLVGGNTDAYGFVTHLDECARGWDDGKVALVLGAGGASRAIIFALIKRGFKHVHVVNRTVSRAEKLAHYFGSRVSAHHESEAQTLMPYAHMIVNTTSLGMKGDNETKMMIDVSMADRRTIISDIVYTPIETAFLTLARRAGLTVVDGLGMLLHQAVPGFERWFHIKPTVTTELRSYILADIARQEKTEK